MDLFVGVKAQKHKPITSGPTLEAQTASSGSWENNKIKAKSLINAIALENQDS